jgi:hypothetical protein
VTEFPDLAGNEPFWQIVPVASAKLQSWRAAPVSSRLAQRKEHAAYRKCEDIQTALALDKALLDRFPDYRVARF